MPWLCGRVLRGKFKINAVKSKDVFKDWISIAFGNDFCLNKYKRTKKHQLFHEHNTGFPHPTNGNKQRNISLQPSTTPTIPKRVHYQKFIKRIFCSSNLKTFPPKYRPWHEVFLQITLLALEEPYQLCLASYRGFPLLLPDEHNCGTDPNQLFPQYHWYFEVHWRWIFHGRETVIFGLRFPKTFLSQSLSRATYIRSSHEQVVNLLACLYRRIV